jgi:ADP-ribosylglycohydrolase
LIGGAIGDAMGRPNEGVWPSEARERQILAYQPWPGWRSGPKGAITDDTQMTMWLAESILASARRAGDEGVTGVRDHLLDPADLASGSDENASGRSDKPC